MPPSQRPSVSLFDIFIGSGRTIRRSSGPPGTHWSNKPSTSRAVAAAAAAAAATDDASPPSNDNNDPGKKDSGSGKGTEPKNSDDAKGKAKANDDNAETVDSKKNQGEEKAKEIGGDTVVVMAVFTTEEDAKLMDLKVERGLTWKQIAEEMKRPRWQVQQRFKAIKAEGNAKGGVGEKEQGQEKKDKKSKSEKKKGEKDGVESSEYPVVEVKVSGKTSHRRRASKERQHRKHDHHKSYPIATSTSSTTSTSVSKTKSHLSINTSPHTLNEDETFSFGELGAISEIIDRDLSALWTRVSAGFFDVSGRRIAPEVIRDKFLELE